MYSNSNVVVTGGRAMYVAGDSVIHNHELSQGFGQLLKHVAAGARHNSDEVSGQPKCHPGTRVAILEYLEVWAQALTYLYSVLWLHGPAGSGKSSILRTIAQILFEQKLLLASFFFFRHATGRNRSDQFIATIAYQLSCAIPDTRPYIVKALEKEPLLFSLSLWAQADALIVSPILSLRKEHPNYDFSQFPRVIIVDGLDECHNPDKQCQILQVLCRILHVLPIPLCVLVASRPEHHIRDAFDVGDLNKLTSRLSLDNFYNPDLDIKKYLMDRFKAIQEKHHLKSFLPPSSHWPSQDVVDKLVASASGQFIYASTVDKFISSARHNPAIRLDMILGIVNAGNLKPFEQLDSLYSTIFNTVDPDDLPGTLRILGILLVPYQSEHLESFSLNFRSPSFVQHLLKLNRGEIQRFFFDLESLLTIDGEKEVRFFHASLRDYLFDRSRSHQFWIDTGLVYSDLAQHSTIQLSDAQHWMESDRVKFKYFFHLNGSLFFSKATPTLELRKAIEDFDLPNVVNFSLWSREKEQANYFSDITPAFMQAIRCSAFQDANELYLQMRASYAQIIRLRFPIYFQSIGLRHLLIVAALEGSRRAVNVGALVHLFNIPEATWDMQSENGLDLDNSSSALLQVTDELLNDKSDSNIGYYVDENDYADIALHVINQVTKVSIAAWNTIRPILPRLLPRASIRQDLLDRIQILLLQDILLVQDISPMRTNPNLVKDALIQYMSRCEGLVSANMHHTSFEHEFSAGGILNQVGSSTNQAVVRGGRQQGTNYNKDGPGPKKFQWWNPFLLLRRRRRSRN